MLVLIIVAGGALGFLVLWFTIIRHERTVLHRARRRSSLQPELIGASGTALFSGTGHSASATAAVREYEPIEQADDVDVAAVDDVVAEADVVEAEGVEAENAPETEPETEADADADAEAEIETEPSKVEPEPAPTPEPEIEAPATPTASATPQQPQPSPQPPSPQQPAVGQRKLTDEILSRVECEIAEREGWRWKDLANLVHHEFGVSVHPSTIQKALKKRRRAEATTADPAGQYT
jgi:outer membrane biosynthesis protein TonB